MTFFVNSQFCQIYRLALQIRKSVTFANTNSQFNIFFTLYFQKINFSPEKQLRIAENAELFLIFTSFFSLSTTNLYPSTLCRAYPRFPADRRLNLPPSRPRLFLLIAASSHQASPRPSPPQWGGHGEVGESGTNTRGGVSTDTPITLIPTNRCMPPSSRSHRRTSH